MTVLKCIRCHQIIKPDEQIVCVVAACPSQWISVMRQLNLTPGRWHLRCTPSAVRGYAPGVTPEGDPPEIETTSL